MNCVTLQAELETLTTGGAILRQKEYEYKEKAVKFPSIAIFSWIHGKTTDQVGTNN